MAEIISKKPKLDTFLKTEQSDTQTVLFFSYDIVNSTRLKTEHDNWPAIIDDILWFIVSEICGQTDCRVPDAQVWKYVGDEVLFYLQVESRQQLSDVILSIYSVLNDTYLHIHSKTDIRPGISVKAAAWITDVSDCGTQNIYKVFSSRDNDFREFLGPRIDAGFRMAHEGARDRQLVVSFELAYILLATEKFSEDGKNKLHIVTFRTMKGVWGDSLYPIIWFFRQSHPGENIEDTFPTSLRHSEFLSEFMHSEKNPDPNAETKAELDRICDERKAEAAIEKIVGYMKKTENDIFTGQRE